MDKRLLDSRYEMEHVVLPEFFYNNPSDFFKYAKTKNIPWDVYEFVCNERNRDKEYTPEEFSITAQMMPGDIKFVKIGMPPIEKNFDCENIYALSDVEYSLYFIVEYEPQEQATKKNPNPYNKHLYYLTIDGTKEYLLKLKPEDDVDDIILDFFRQDL